MNAVWKWVESGHLPGIRSVLRCLLILLLAGACCTKVAASEFEWPDGKISKVYQEFLAAYNTNNEEQLIRFVKKYHKSRNTQKIAHYWLRVYTEYGRLVPFSIEASQTDESRLGLWLQGKHTKSWAMIVFRMDPGLNKIVRKGLRRGDRPNIAVPPFVPVKAKQIASHLQSYLEELEARDHFSGAVLVARGGKVLFKGAYGYRDKEHRQKNAIDTSFKIASVTKSFTGVALAHLVQSEKLQFSDTLDKFIPEYPKDISRQVSVHHLLTHTSGLEFDDHPAFNTAMINANSVEELLKAQITYMDHMNEGRRSNFKVLNKYDYSNENYALVAVIIERVSGMSYAEYLEKNISIPLDLQNTFADYLKLSKHKNKAVGYTYRDLDGNYRLDKRRPNTDLLWKFANPAGGVYSSVEDLYRYFHAVIEGKLVNASMRDMLLGHHTTAFSDPKNNTYKYYGYGFHEKVNGELRVIGHSGSYPGVGARFQYYSGHDIYVIVLSNYGSIASGHVAGYVNNLIEPRAFR